MLNPTITTIITTLNVLLLPLRFYSDRLKNIVCDFGLAYRPPQDASIIIERCCLLFLKNSFIHIIL